MLVIRGMQIGTCGPSTCPNFVTRLSFNLYEWRSFVQNGWNMTGGESIRVPKPWTLEVHQGEACELIESPLKPQHGM